VVVLGVVNSTNEKHNRISGHLLYPWIAVMAANYVVNGFEKARFLKARIGKRREKRFDSL
jgi:hypothetical protein